MQKKVQAGVGFYTMAPFLQFLEKSCASVPF